MKILIIGNDPHEIGGVANYTRPLAQSFADLGHDVCYFFSGAWNKRYDWHLKPYIKINKNDYPYECAELVNSPCWTTNYGNPVIDISEAKTEELFNAYLDRVKPDVVHIHSRMGLPASIVKCAATRGMPVVSTVHVYGFLCQKRVMIDYLGDACQGPSDLEKCALCTGKINIGKLKFSARIANTKETLLNFMVRAKHFVKGILPDPVCEDANTIAHIQPDPVLVKGLAKRLAYMISLMNSVIDTTICVSEDVKKTLMQFGVHEDRLLVQHIGSLIAETQCPRENKIHEPIAIGNIGGVGYYKGTHVLVEAVAKMKSGGFCVKIFGKYDAVYKSGLIKGREHLPIEFAGSYVLEKLPEILDQIDIMVLPSICNDTAPQTIFESYSRYVPIVASNIGGFPDFVKDGTNGRLFKPGDADQLAEILDNLVNEPSQIRIFSEQIPKLKTIRHNTEELLSLYESLRSKQCFM
jgi:glycosyltransferase involved in cell wall biosynthesis